MDFLELKSFAKPACQARIESQELINVFIVSGKNDHHVRLKFRQIEAGIDLVQRFFAKTRLSKCVCLVNKQHFPSRGLHDFARLMGGVPDIRADQIFCGHFNNI